MSRVLFVVPLLTGCVDAAVSVGGGLFGVLRDWLPS
jgi:hypothetical protein